MEWPEGTNPQLLLETDKHNEPGSPARVVTWIPWDSGFRGTGLRVGDLIVGHGDVRYTAQTVEERSGIGDANFSRWFDAQKFKPGAALPLTVLRDGKETVIKGKVGGYLAYRNAEGKRMLSAEGPVEYEKDGFDYDWTSWYRQFVDLARQGLADWDYFLGTVTHQLAQRIAPFETRVVFLEKKYPGPFARAVREDLDAMKANVAGEERTFTPVDLAHRSLGPVRAKAVAAAADEAFASFLAEVKDEMLPNPPEAPNPFEEDTRPLAGKVLQLKDLGRRQLLFETQRSWYWSGSGKGGYLVDRRSPSLQAFFKGLGEYVEKVDPAFKEHTVSFVGKAQPEPALVSDPHRSITVAGVRVEPLAALAVSEADKANRFFVDLRPGKTESFAGEAALDAGIQKPALADDFPPERVLLTAFDALKVGHFETWLSCFAHWAVRAYYQGRDSYEYVDRTWEVMGERSGASVWDKARQRLLEDVYGVEIARVGPVRTVLDGAEKVEEVGITVNHIGKVGKEFRTFAGPQLHRKWHLQRLDGGPWRIISPYGV